MRGLPQPRFLTGVLCPLPREGVPSPFPALYLAAGARPIGFRGRRAAVQ